MLSAHADKVGLSAHADKVGLSAHADTDCFPDKPTLSVRRDNMGFLRKTGFIREKPTLSVDNVGFFRKKILYLRETHII